MTDKTLLPCPFCGGEAHISASSDGYGVECWNRRCIDMQLEEIPTEAEAIRAWNTRAGAHCPYAQPTDLTEGCALITERTCRIEERDELPYPVCSVCGAVQPDDYTVYYCWSCGAKVVGE